MQRATLGGEKDQARVLALLQRHGRTTLSFLSLGPGYRYAFFGEDACVPFVDTGRAWVTVGGPIAAEEHLGTVADAFVHEARTKRRRVVFFGTEERFRERAKDTMSYLLIGEQPVWDPRAWTDTVGSTPSLKEQVRRARAKGVTVLRISHDELLPNAASRKAVNALVARWLRTRPMAPMGFVVQVEPFSAYEERLYYGAWRQETLVGFLALVPVYSKDGWFFENLLRDPSAPNGTVELLFDAAMRDLSEENVSYATLGLSPLSGPVVPFLRHAARWGRPLYDFDGLRAFKQKLRPQAWAPVYLSFPRGDAAWLAIWDALSAFARGGALRFGMATLLRGPDLVVRALTLMLVPWTLLLAWVDPTRWFPTPQVRAAWIVFDVVLALGLFALVRIWRPWLATVLAAAITLDAALTLTEAILWNASRIRTIGDVLVVSVAVAAPTLSAITMWNARARHAHTPMR